MAALTPSSSSTASFIIDPQPASLTFVPSIVINPQSTSTIAVPVCGAHIEQLIVDSVNQREGTAESLNATLEAIEKMLSSQEHASGRDFCMRFALDISDVHYPDSKYKALNLFIRFLLEDPLTQESSAGLVNIAKNLMNAIDLSTTTSHHSNPFLEKYLECYALLIEMILVHYGKGHIPSLLKDFKTQFAAAETKIQALYKNKQMPTSFLYACLLIFEGLKRIKIDQKASAEIFARLKKLTDLVKQVADKNFTEAFKSLAATRDGLDKYLKEMWYKNWLICMALAREISPRTPENHASNLIETFQHAVKQHSDMRSIYGAVQILGRVASQQASTPALRNTVILGRQPNLVSFLQFDLLAYKSIPTYKPIITSLEYVMDLETRRAMNLEIRQVAINVLKNFLEMRSEDRDTCLAVKIHLIAASLQEQYQKEMGKFFAFIPKDPPAMLSWLNASVPIVTATEPPTPTS